MTRQTSMQLTPATEAQVEWLKAQGHGPQFTDLVRVAIDRMAREEGMNMTTYTIMGVKAGGGYELRLCAGKKSVHAVTYWPDQKSSIAAAYDLIYAEAQRLGVTISE